MENFLEDDYSGLIKIVKDTITNGMKSIESASFFPMAEFRDKMEVEFAKLGFRDNSSYDARGGGVKRILIIRPAALGDLINTSPAIREIRKNYPSTHITLVVSMQEYSMARLCPYVNEVVPFCDDVKLDEKKKLLEILAYCGDFAEKNFWKRRYDLGFSFRYFTNSHLISLLLLYLSGAKYRVGYISRAYRLYCDNVLPPEKNPGNIFLTHPVINPKEIIHNCARMLYLLQATSLKVRETEQELWYDSTDFYKAKNLLKDFAPDKIKISLSLGVSSPIRKYPSKKLLPALKKIISKGAAIIIFGGPDEADEAKFFQENLPEDSVMNLTEILPGRRVEAALIAQTDLYLGTFTGTLDVASAANIPSIALIGEPKTREKDLWGLSFYTTFYPWQAKVLVVRPEEPLGECKLGGLFWDGCGGGNPSKGSPHCITQIEPEEIVAAYDEMIHFLKNSPIKKINSPITIRRSNQTEQLKYIFLNNARCHLWITRNANVWLRSPMI